MCRRGFSFEKENPDPAARKTVGLRPEVYHPSCDPTDADSTEGMVSLSGIVHRRDGTALGPMGRMRRMGRLTERGKRTSRDGTGLGLMGPIGLMRRRSKSPANHGAQPFTLLHRSTAIPLHLDQLRRSHRSRPASSAPSPASTLRLPGKCHWTPVRIVFIDIDQPRRTV